MRQNIYSDKNMIFNDILARYRKSGNFGHGFILAPKYKVPKLNTPKYVALQKLTTKIN